MEATWRSLHQQLTGKDIPASKLHRFRINKPYREMTVKAGMREVKIASVSGLANAVSLVKDIIAGKKQIDLLEVMACPGGCANGGGQPLPVNEALVRSRSKAIYDMDNGAEIQAAHLSPIVQRIYKEFLGEPGGEMSRNLLYTTYTLREVLK
jgi:iron only hydrogenase large subunit-like protein